MTGSDSGRVWPDAGPVPDAAIDAGAGLGTMCNADAECASGFCVDGVCCTSPCTEECRTCALIGNEGSCEYVPYYEEDPAYSAALGVPAQCAGVERCSGDGACRGRLGSMCREGFDCLGDACSTAMTCLGAPGEPCRVGTECVSGACVFGVDICSGPGGGE